MSKEKVQDLICYIDKGGIWHNQYMGRAELSPRPVFRILLKP